MRRLFAIALALALPLPAAAIGIALRHVPGESGAAWTPARLKPVLWLSPGRSVTTSGTAVTSWAPRYGAGTVTQGTGSKQPTYVASSLNGRPGLTFDGGDVLTNATIATLNGAEYTLALVTTTTVAAAQLPIRVGVAAGTSLGSDTDRKRLISLGGIGLQKSTTAMTLSTPELGILTKVSGANLALRVNGAALSLASSVTTYNAADAGLFLGGSTATPAAPFTGTMYDVLWWGDNLSTAQTTLVEDYFRRRYGLW